MTSSESATLPTVEACDDASMIVLVGCQGHQNAGFERKKLNG